MLLRIEPFSGISGDMMLGALVDLTGRGDVLRALPGALGLEDVTVTIDPTAKCGIRCTQVTVVDRAPPRPRHLADILALMDAADLPDRARALARRVFRRLGEAEAAVHGIPLEEVHFHEVGAVDSIVDIVGAAVLLADLPLDGVVCGPVRTGHGFVDCDHGRLPVPAPATERLLRGMPTFAGDVEAEMTTPTGAAILRALSPSFARPALTVTATGYGAGRRDFPHPNCLRLSLAEAVAADLDAAEVWLLQANLDDTTGELLGEHLQGLLVNAGALDVSLCPLLMKKGRPGHRLEVLCAAGDLPALVDTVLAETSTIGVRYFPVQRTVLPRTLETAATRYGEVRLKVVTLPSGRLRKTPEYEDCRRLAVETGSSLQDVMREALGHCGPEA